MLIAVGRGGEDPGSQGSADGIVLPHAPGGRRDTQWELPTEQGQGRLCKGPQALYGKGPLRTELPLCISQ